MELEISTKKMPYAKNSHKKFFEPKIVPKSIILEKNSRSEIFTF